MSRSLQHLATFTLLTLVTAIPAPGAERNLTTDEPRHPKGKPPTAADYQATVPPTAGQHLAGSLHKLQHGIQPHRPFLIWAIGSSYTNMLGNGEFWQTEIPKRFPKAPPIEYRKMVGNSCPWQYLTGWARHLVIPDQPDLIITYTKGNPQDLETLIIELRRHCTADIIVPSIHWRERDQPLWDQSENAADQDVAAIRAICAKHQVEFVENRQLWADYLRANNLPIQALLKDAVHQSDYGAHIINSNILAHFQPTAPPSYQPQEREYSIQPSQQKDGSIHAEFTGTRLDLIARRHPHGGQYQLQINGQPSSQTTAFLTSYIQPGADNYKSSGSTAAADGKKSAPVVPRDSAPHGIALGTNIIPQTWTLLITSDQADYQLTGSITGPDGSGRASQTFTSTSGQILIDPTLWRRSENNRKGDRFTFEVSRATMNLIDLSSPQEATVTLRLAQMLPNQTHQIQLIPIGNSTPDDINLFQAYRPPHHQPTTQP